MHLASRIPGSTRWRAWIRAYGPAALAAVVVIATGLALPGGGEDDPGGGWTDPLGVVRVAIGEPPSLAPTDADPTGDAGHVLAALFTPLVGYDRQGRPVPLAAESVEPGPDRRVWTVTLRDGYTFHNGEPVTADRYLDAWNFAAYGPSRQRNNYYFERIEGYAELNPRHGGEPAARTLSGLAKLDDRRFTVTLTEPFAEFPAMLGAPAFYPLPRAALPPGGGSSLADGFAIAPVGNGPFRMVSWRPGDRIELAPHPEHPGEPPPRIDGVEFVFYPTPEAGYADLRAGEVEVVTEIPAGKLSTVESELGDRYLRLPGAGLQFLAFPAYQTELADPEIRRAISMAIDREEIATGVFRDTQPAARSFVPPVVPGAQPDGCGPACRYDPVAARDRYAQAGGPAELTLTYNTDGGHQDWVAATCDQLRAHLGVACTPQPVPEFADLLARLDRQEPVGMVRLGWEMDFPSIASYLDPMFASDGSANLHGYHNPELDAQLAAAAAAGSPEAALAGYRRAEAILARDLPVIPLRFDTHTIGHSPAVREVTLTRMGQLDLARIEITGGQ